MTVRENLELGSYTKKAWESKQETIEEVYRIFPRLKERERQFTKTLSGGEQQMVAIARGLMSKPRLCLFDEPSFGLSPIIVAEVFEVIKILQEQGTTIFLVEQNVQHSLEMANRAYVLENGEIVLEGKGQVVLHNKNIEATFLGL